MAVDEVTFDTVGAVVSMETELVDADVGAVVSIVCADCVATAECVNVAAFPAVSTIVPEFNSSVFAVNAKPSASVSPDATVYDNTIDVVPEPDAYVAYFDVNPASAIRGEPVIVTASENTTVTLTVSPDLYVLSTPADDEKLTDDTVGAVVSMVIASAVDEVCVSVTLSRVVVAVERNL